MTPLWIALWQRDRMEKQVSSGSLMAHSNAGSQYAPILYTEHLDHEGTVLSIGTPLDRDRRRRV